MELALLWVNRLLFLKLLESQLATYHRGDPAYRFMAPGDLKDFDDLYSLFFGVLAVRPGDRREKYAHRWSRVPYLNSSLFEQSETEKRVLSIDRLDNHAELPVWGRSVLKTEDGKRASGTRTTLGYLLSFLDAFDFSSEGTGDVQDSGKTLINASVLGLIFEKINGYKEGAFFTPGYITQYMAHQSVRSALVTQFNRVKGWNCETLTDVYNRIEDRAEANAVVNSLKILDPAVGSGHFLVSVLNELIAAKSELGLLVDGQGKRLKGYQAVVENDELFLLDEDGEFVTYHAPFRAGEAQRVWETIFHEKKALIEGCLFGVDINPNSVQICKLRLWIELLKHAFYTPDSDYRELETLPNLDIKIRTGNSLVSRYALDVPLNKIGSGDGGLMAQYLELVKAYQETPDKRTKAQIEEHIASIKARIVADLEETRPLKRRWELARDKLAALTQDELFGLTDKERKDRDKKRKPVEAELATLTAQLEDESRNPIFAHSFEWRFEFPEVLDPETGAFVGFDVVIGNPPYIRQEELTPFKRYFEGRYEAYDGVADLYVYFVERAMTLLVAGGWFGYILPNKWMRAHYGKPLRTWIKDQYRVRSLIDFGDLPVFEAATTYPCLLFLAKTPARPSFPALTVNSLEDLDLEALMTSEGFEVDRGTLDSEGWILVDQKSAQLLQRLLAWGTPLGQAVGGRVYRGVLTGLNEAFVIDRATRDRLVAEDPKCETLLKPFLVGRDIKRYQYLQTDRFLVFTRRGVDIDQFPSIKTYLEKFRTALEPRPDSYQSVDWPGRKSGTYQWYELQDSIAYWENFETPKIMWPEIAQSARFTFEERSLYSNNKTYILPTSSPGLLGILNSRLVRFVLHSISAGLQGDSYNFSEIYVERIPLPPSLFPPISSSASSAPPRDPSSSSPPPEAEEIESLVTRILAAKKADPAADTQALEDRIDQLVYRLYGLTDEEIAIVEGKG